MLKELVRNEQMVVEAQLDTFLIEGEDASALWHTGKVLE